MSARRAFTILELMIVVGGIAVLMAILLPALATAQKVSREAKCRSNARQATIAALLDSSQINLFKNFYNTYVDLADTDVLECPEDLTPGVLPVTSELIQPIASAATGTESSHDSNSSYSR